MSTDLIKKLEGLSGPVTASRDLEKIIRLSPWYSTTPSSDPLWPIFVRAIGGSVDAAISLAERVLPNERVQLNRIPFEGKCQWSASLTGDYTSWSSVASIAICIAILKAKEQQK